MTPLERMKMQRAAYERSVNEGVDAMLEEVATLLKFLNAVGYQKKWSLRYGQHAIEKPSDFRERQLK